MIFCFTSRSRIFHICRDVTFTVEGLKILGLCSALGAFEQGGIFIMPHLLCLFVWLFIATRAIAIWWLSPLPVTAWAANLGLCSALRAFEQGGIFIVPHVLRHGTGLYGLIRKTGTHVSQWDSVWHGTSVFPVSSEGFSCLLWYTRRCEGSRISEIEDRSTSVYFFTSLIFLWQINAHHYTDNKTLILIMVKFCEHNVFYLHISTNHVTSVMLRSNNLVILNNVRL
jgi:hypothetical protein